MTYNGWTNWETWKFNLEVAVDELDGCATAGVKFSTSDEIEEHLRSLEDHMYLSETDVFKIFINGIMAKFLEKVNFQEIAENWALNNKLLDYLKREGEEDQRDDYFLVLILPTSGGEGENQEENQWNGDLEKPSTPPSAR